MMKEKEKKSVVNERYMPTLKLISVAVGFDKIKEKGARVKYPVYLSKELSETSIEVLELSVRASNSMRRAGYHTIGALVENIESGDDLQKIRNCGKSSVLEIMLTIMCYQFMQLDPAGQRKYIEQMRAYN